MELNNISHNTLMHQSESQNFKTVCAEMKGSKTNLLVLGEPGVGKSFICQQLLHHHNNAIFIQANSGTSVKNLCKFIGSNLGISFTNGQEVNELDQPNQLLQALMKSHEPFFVIIDDAERLPGNTLATIMQLIQADLALKFVLFGDSTLGEKANALSIPGQLIKKISLESFNEEDVSNMLEQGFGLKLKKNQLAQLIQTTQGNPKQVVEYIRKKQHLRKFKLGRPQLHAGAMVQNLFFMLIGAVIISGFYFTHQFIYKKPIMEPVKVYMDDIKPVDDFRPMVCYPDMQQSENMQAHYQDPYNESTAPLYVIQLLSVKKPSQIKSIEKPLRDFALKPTMIKNNKNQLYTLYLGPYFTHEDASLVLMNLPEELKALNPWVRSTNSVDLV